MQSFLQYRRFKYAVEAQLERKQGLSRGTAEKTPGAEGTTNPTLRTSSDRRDLERGVIPAGQRSYPQNGHNQQAAPGCRPNEVASAGTHSVPQDVQPAMVTTDRPEGEVEPRYSPSDSDQEDDGNDDDELVQQRTNHSTSLSTVATQTSIPTRLGRVMTGINIRKRKTKEGGNGDVFVVGYEGDDDPLNPQNWSFATRLKCTFTVAGIGCVVGIASAIDSAAIAETAAEFGVSEVVASLGTGLFLVGFGLGALFAGPVSETVGRNPVYISTLILYMLFIMGAALAPNLGGWLALRFIAGIFGSTPLTCAGGSVSDLWRPLERVWAFPIFANAAFTGPLLGPVIGGWIAQSPVLSWRWTEWVTLIISGLVLAVVVLFQPETYPPTLLKWKAAHLREITGDDRYRAELEIRQESFIRRLRRALWRPFLLTSREPVVIIIALYLTVVYIVLFGFLDGFDYIFGGTYGTSQGITGTCFLGIIVGLFGASALVPIVYQWAKRDLEKVQEQGGDRLPPEFRLWFSMLGGAFAIPISLFWMGWTARPDISIWSPLAASVLFGYGESESHVPFSPVLIPQDVSSNEKTGILCVFISCYQYIIDSYETYAASALASITLIRYVASGGMVVASIPFYQNLGVAYTCTILGCISALLGMSTGRSGARRKGGEKEKRKKKKKRKERSSKPYLLTLVINSTCTIRLLQIWSSDSIEKQIRHHEHDGELLIYRDKGRQRRSRRHAY